MVLAQSQTTEFYCYRCGHKREEHRKLIRIATRETICVDCLKPVGEKATILAIKWIHVCQCTEYRAKEEVKDVNKPSE